MKTKLFSLVKVTISLSLIGLLFYGQRDSSGHILEAIKKLGPLPVTLACSIFIIAVCLSSLRLNIIFKAQQIRLRYSQTLYLTFIGYFFNNFLPTAIGGDVVKAYYSFKTTGNKLKSFISVFMDRFLGMFALLMMAGVSLIFSYTLIEEAALIWVTIALLAGTTLMLLFFLNEKLARLFSPLARFVRFANLDNKIKETYGIINSFKDKKAGIALSVAISLAAQAMSFAVIYIVAKGLGTPISIKVIMLFMPLVSIASMLPSINGLGIRENAIYFLFGPYIGQKNAFILSLFWLFTLIMVGAIGGIVYLFGRQSGHENKDIAQEKMEVGHA
jgi:uncharacterized protein (TIRG00374 family)